MLTFWHYAIHIPQNHIVTAIPYRLGHKEILAELNLKTLIVLVVANHPINNNLPSLIRFYPIDF